MLVYAVLGQWALANATDAAVAAAETTPAPPAATLGNPESQPDPAVGSWHPRMVDGVEYLPMEDLRSFYTVFFKAILPNTH